MGGELLPLDNVVGLVKVDPEVIKRTATRCSFEDVDRSSQSRQRDNGGYIFSLQCTRSDSIEPEVSSEFVPDSVARDVRCIAIE